MKQNKMRREAVMIVAMLAVAFALSCAARAAPTGAGVTNISWSQKNVSSPSFRNDSKGTITTLLLTATQQDYKWKAYVGNVSSTFTLDDSQDYTIYQWTMDSFSGQIYITKTNSVTWSSINCVNSTAAAAKTGEDTALHHNSGSADSINRTFWQQVHRPFTVGNFDIPANCSYSTSTWKNDTSNALTQNSAFQELLLTDGANLIYTTFVENDKIGYRADNVTTYDFQAIVPEDATVTNPNIAYYFYLELS